MLGFLLSFVIAVLVVSTTESNAAESDDKKEESLYVKIAPVTVNLHGMEHFLQIAMTLKVASPSQAKTVKSNMPIILNELTYLLSDKNASQFETSSGKLVLTQQTRSAINNALSLNARDGVTDVLLESLIVQ